MTEQGQMAITTNLSPIAEFEKYGREMRKLFRDRKPSLKPSRNLPNPNPSFYYTLFHKSWSSCPVPYFKLLLGAESFGTLCIWLGLPPSLAWNRWIMFLFGGVNSWDLLSASAPRATKQDCLCSWKLIRACRIDVAWCCTVKGKWFGIDSK